MGLERRGGWFKMWTKWRYNGDVERLRRSESESNREYMSMEKLTKRYNIMHLKIIRILPQ